MSLIYDLKLFEKELHSEITISIDYFINNRSSCETEYVQGILKRVDIVNDLIEIEQHFPFLSYLTKKETQTLFRTFKNKEFFMIKCGNLKMSK